MFAGDYVADFFQSILCELRSRNAILLSLAIFLCCAISGPFGTYERLHLIERLLFWAPLIIVAHFTVGLSHKVAIEVLRDRSHLYAGAISAVLFSLFYAPFVYIYSRIGPFSNAHSDTTFTYVAVIVLCFALILCVAVVIVQYNKADEVAMPRLYGRLPEGTTGRIMRLTVRDHYVIVCLDTGQEHRLLMRLADAVDEMEHVEGFLTHRSHWVAKESIHTAGKRDAREFLRMTCGAEVPVSKTYRSNVEQAGFL